MKKVMFVVLALVFAVSAFAQTSNKVMFTKFTAASSGVAGTAANTAFGLPAQTWLVVSNVPQYGTDSWHPRDVIGAQITPGSVSGADKIVDQNTLEEARLTTTGTWAGSMSTNSSMGPGHAYWIQNKSVTAYPVVLAGQVNNGGYTPYLGDIVMVAPGAAGQVSSKPISWRESRVVDVWNLNLKSDGFTGGTVSTTDKLVEQGSLEEARCTVAAVDGNATGWSGGLSTGAVGVKGMKPGKAYWVQNKHVGNTWTYHYDGGPALMTTGDSGISTPAAVITKVPASQTKVNMINNVNSTKAGAPKSTKSSTKN